MEHKHRYFVRIEAPNRRALIALGDMGLDLFEEVTDISRTERAAKELPYQIGGLINMEQVEKLVLGGYRVTVEEEASKRARAAQTVIDFEQWLKEMGE